MTNPFLNIIGLWAILIVLGLSIVGFLLALFIRIGQGKGAGAAALNGLETGLCVLLGGLLAQAMVALPLWLGDGSKAAEIGTSFFFLIWPGIVNLAAAPFSGNQALIGTDGIMWFALAAGAGIGFFDGFRRIHDWAFPGILTFIGDLTWGLPLNVNAFLIHLINLVWGTPQDEPRKGAHRYVSGFRIKGNFAFTQGNLLTNLSSGPGTGIYNHEQTHVLQNRVFGPFFWMTYFGWLILFGAIGLIGSLVSRGRNSAGVRLGADYPMWWGYFNNPWELWAYTHNPTGRTGNLPSGDGLGWLDWPAVLKVIFTIIGEAILVILILLSIWMIWF